MEHLGVSGRGIMSVGGRAQTVGTVGHGEDFPTTGLTSGSSSTCPLCPQTGSFAKVGALPDFQLNSQQSLAESQLSVWRPNKQSS